jgi:hypothetical protein
MYVDKSACDRVSSATWTHRHPGEVARSPLFLGHGTLGSWAMRPERSGSPTILPEGIHASPPCHGAIGEAAFDKQMTSPVIAVLVPARRAMRVEALNALRSE